MNHLLLVRSALCRSGLNPLQHGVSGALPRNQNRQRNGRNGEDDGTPGCHLGEDIDGSARSKGGLRALSAKRASQICTFPRLQQDNPDQNKTNDDVKNGKEINHWVTFKLKTECATATEKPGSWCGRGDLNPHAFRRHPLKMVCLPFHHFRGMR